MKHKLKIGKSGKNRFSKPAAILFILIFAGVGAYVIVRSFASTPTPVPAASVNGVTVGPGFVEASARQVVRTASNKVYVIANDDTPCQVGSNPGVTRAWKGTGAQAANANVPTGFTEVDAAHHPTSAGSGVCTDSNGPVLFNPDLRLDNAGIIHMAYIDTSGSNLYYQTFSTITDTWGAKTLLATGAQSISGAGWPRGGQVALTLDASDNPQVVYATSGSSNSLRFIAKVNGSWSNPVTITSGTNLMHPSMVTSLDGSLQLAWLTNSLAAHSGVSYSRYSSGSWSTPEVVSSGDNIVLGNGDDDQSPSIATDSQNRPHVLYMDGTVNGSDNYVRMRYRTAAGSWVDNTPAGTAGASNPNGTWYAHTPQNYISSNDDDWVFLGHDRNISPGGYQYQIGGPGNNWSAYSTIEPRNNVNTTAGAPGIDGSASVRFDPLRDNNPGIIDLLYFDENDGSTAGHHATIFYKAVDLGSVTTPPDTTPPDTTITSNPGSSTTNTSATFNFSSTESGSTFQCSLDGSAYTGCTSPKTYTGLSTGNHTFSVKATDSSNNTDASPASFSWTITAASGTAPSNTSIPVISGTSRVSSTLAVSNGAWSGDTPITYTYQWQTCTTLATSSCSNVATNGTSSTYTLSCSEYKLYVRAIVKATNATGNSTANTNLTAAITKPTDPVKGDFDDNCFINASDVALFVDTRHWRSKDASDIATYDISGPDDTPDGSIDVWDLTLLLSNLKYKG